jgi:hypothetical protein
VRCRDARQYCHNLQAAHALWADLARDIRETNVGAAQRKGDTSLRVCMAKLRVGAGVCMRLSKYMQWVCMGMLKMRKTLHGQAQGGCRSIHLDFFCCDLGAPHGHASVGARACVRGTGD